jgi:hypothetical protein
VRREFSYLSIEGMRCRDIEEGFSLRHGIGLPSTQHV